MPDDADKNVMAPARRHVTEKYLASCQNLCCKSIEPDEFEQNLPLRLAENIAENNQKESALALNVGANLDIEENKERISSSESGSQSSSEKSDVVERTEKLSIMITMNHKHKREMVEGGASS